MSDLPMKQEDHPAHNMPRSNTYSHDVLSTPAKERDTMFTYDEPYQPNQNYGDKGPVREEMSTK